MDGDDATGQLLLAELVELSRWQRLQDHFARVLGIPIRTISPTGEHLVNPGWPSSFDAERAVSLLKIGDEVPQLLSHEKSPREASSLTTPLGITYAIVPIRTTGEQIIAHFVIGPMVVGLREEELQFRHRVSAMGLDPEVLWPVILSLKLYTFAGIRSALNLIEEVGTAIAQLAYQVKQLGSIFPGGDRVTHEVPTYHADRILHSLLEAATLATKADGGSVMISDPNSGRLHVKAAQGLSAEVVSRAALQQGEGLAGLARAERRILLIDEQTTDERIRSRMHRPELVSSIVAPLVLEATREPIGVLSLRTARPDHRFTQEHIELLRRLLDLACAALHGLHTVYYQT